MPKLEYQQMKFAIKYLIEKNVHIKKGNQGGVG
jgi:hypothetical protein